MKSSIKTLAALTGVFAATVAQAQTTTVTRVHVSPAQFAAVTGSLSTAGASFGSPLAYGANWGSAGIGAFAQTLKDDDNPASFPTEDGALGLVMGFGNSNKAVGLEVGMALSSILKNKGAGGGFGDNGSFSAKLHTSLPGSAAFAVGINGIGRFGDENDVNRSSVYAVGSKQVPVKLGSSSKNLVLNLGVGDGDFSDEADGVGVFGSAALYFTQQVSVIVDYTGIFLNTGVSVAPLKKYPLTVTLGAINVAAERGSPVQFGVQAGYGFTF